LISLPVWLLAVLALAACGDSSEGGQPATTGSTVSVTTPDEVPPSGETDGAGGEDTDAAPALSDPEGVSAAIEALLTDPDNEFVCDQVLSEKLLRSAYGDRRGCRDQRQPEVLGDSVTINGLKVAGNTATAVAITKGGFYDGEKLDVVAVRAGKDWRIEQFISNVPVGP
jgi:hypothetical protein